MKKKTNNVKKYASSFRDACYFVKCAFRLNPQGVLIRIPEILLRVLFKIMPIILLREILNSIQESAPIQSIMIRVLIYASVLLICNVALSWIKFFSERQTSKTDRLIRKDLTKLVTKITYYEVEKPETRTLLQMVENHVNVSELLNHVVDMIMQTLVLLGVISIVCTLQPLILLVILVVLIVRALVNKLTRSLWNKWRVPINDKMRKVNYLINILNDPSFGKEIRINGLQQWVAEKMNGAEQEYLDTMSDYNKQQQTRNFFVELAVVFQELIVYLYLAYRVFFHGLLIGDFSMYISSISTFSSSFSSVINSFSEILKAGDFLSLYRDIVERNEQEGAKEIDTKSNEFVIKFDHVSFIYPNTSKLVLKDVSLEIKSGESLSIIGLNGAGKTTLIKLLCRFYKPTSGTISINGTDIYEITNKEYKKILSVAFQDYKLFAFSVADNVSLSPEYDEKRLYDALSKTGLMQKVDALPQKEKTAMGKILDDQGVEFSGGESQRIELCRVLYKDAPIVILDEPTASLDPFKEYELYKLMFEYIGNRCSIFISHRLASTRFTKNIAVFKDGEIVEYGNFDSLMSMDQGIFKSFFELQSSYYER